MAERVVLHIGTMKSGTSFVQSALAANPAALEAAGGCYLGGSFGRQAKAIRDVFKHPAKRDHHGRWQALADEARAYDGEAGIVSMEFLSFAADRHLPAFLDPLAGLEVEVVVTVRDQLRAVPAQWQTYTRNFGTEDWSTYQRQIDVSGWGRGRKSRAAMTFHRAQDVVPVLQRWSADPRVARLTVVTLPPPDAPREELWRRFCTAAQVPAEAAELGGLHENPSLGYASCDFLRRLNVHLADVKPRRYRLAMRPLTRHALAPLRESEARPELDRRGSELALRLNDRIRDAITSGGYALVGTPDDLPVSAPSGAPVKSPVPPEDQVRRAALAVHEYVVRQLGTDPGPVPDDLDRSVPEIARLLRRANRWGR